MKKQNALDYLVRNLEEWPTASKYAPIINGYRWVKESPSGIAFLFDDTATYGEMEDLKITKNEWLNAQFKKMIATPPLNKQKIYIAGGMTGYENFNRKAFNDAELKLSLNYIVLNPAILPEGLSQKDYMSICLPMVACCDVIYMLDGYEDSSGALSELALAEKLGLKVILENK